MASSSSPSPSPLPSGQGGISHTTVLNLFATPTPWMTQLLAELQTGIIQKIDEVSAKIDEVDARLNTKIDEVSAKIDDVYARLSTKIDEVEASFGRTQKSMGYVHESIVRSKYKNW